MSQTIEYSLVRPNLLDIVDEEWMRDTLPDDSKNPLGHCMFTLPGASTRHAVQIFQCPKTLQSTEMMQKTARTCKTCKTKPTSGLTLDLRLIVDTLYRLGSWMPLGTATAKIECDAGYPTCRAHLHACTVLQTCVPVQEGRRNVPASCKRCFRDGGPVMMEPWFISKGQSVCDGVEQSILHYDGHLHHAAAGELDPAWSWRVKFVQT
jgi:hypothetical protein